MTAGLRRRRVRVERAVEVPDELGGTERISWGRLADRWTEWRFIRGLEAPEPGGQSGSAFFKVRLPQDPATKSIMPTDRLRDLQTQEVFNIRAVDVVTDLQNVWLDVTGGVAT